MRRLLSIVLLAIFGLGPAISALPAGALSSGFLSWSGKVDASRLPACCRRGGKHHCALASMASAMDGSRGETAVGANDPCPFAPQSMALTAPSISAVLAPGTEMAQLASELCVVAGVRNVAALAGRRSQPKRGPPALVTL